MDYIGALAFWLDFIQENQTGDSPISLVQGPRKAFLLHVVSLPQLAAQEDALGEALQYGSWFSPCMILMSWLGQRFAPWGLLGPLFS